MQIKVISVCKLKSNHQVISLDDKLKKGSESFRLLRTNLNHLLPDSKNEGQAIIISSTSKNEGKSFISLNLASSLAILNK